MSFWKPGEAFPDGMDEENMEVTADLPLGRLAQAQNNHKVNLSENTKNLPFMVRSKEEKLRRKEEIVALKELKSYMWSYRKVTPTENMTISTHPCSGPAINTLEEEECKRFSFGGFNSKVDDIMKEREAYRQMKRSGKQVMKTVGSDDIMDTLNK
ncbi:hypothetical protein JH06_2460 [Blastocystis sp. subtype 4]|uniref:hypothetical protein n=1 Tax=Blastocystis sp. subtype 4 TaxID=944170 RepID=UPI00071133A0|nr:hypothetical protein JH06_2460 [Blastocystis sp. subtype 4]KNB43687.1 hypothetical protein JH06_2460 [Blastocystis sp. subtype 4]|eukprot:XP_014527130.1 hypothetical protein JH06_2460 [Blastocystis sp. subtype 4]